MSQGAYNTQLNPPAPFVLIRLTNPADGTQSSEMPAQLDTAADRTVVPLSCLESLGLQPIDEMLAAGLGGEVVTLSAHVASLTVLSFEATVLCVIGHPDEPWILLGRDVLNSFRIVLDGPNLALQIE